MMFLRTPYKVNQALAKSVRATVAVLQLSSAHSVMDQVNEVVACWYTSYIAQLPNVNDVTNAINDSFKKTATPLHVW